MSKIARNPVALPKDVTFEVSGKNIKVKGPKGELTAVAHDMVSFAVEEKDGVKRVVVSKNSDERLARALWGTWRSHVKNMVEGVTKGYTKNLDIQGVGYRANLQGTDLVLALGYSHEVRYAVPKGITITVDKQTKLAITGIDKQRVGQVAAEIISWRPPEPYKGKGIRHEGGFVLRKEGKKK
jgi:large subunit ribosomal protein L6